MSDAAEMIEAVENESPAVVRLAEVVSLAVIVDRPLLRRARLLLVPGANVGVEADLWLSPFVRSRSLDGLVLQHNVVEELRSRLAGDPERLQRAWETTESLHRHLSPALRIEEEIAWLSVCGHPGTVERIQDLLRSALTALVDKERKGIAHWAVRALPNLPLTARATEEAQMLEVSAHLWLNGVVHPHQLGEQIPDWLSWVIPAEFPRVSVRVRLLPGAVELDGAGAKEGNLLQLPKTNPLWIEVAWLGQDGKHSIQVTFQAEEKVTTPIPVDQVQLRVLSGEVYQLNRTGAPERGNRVLLSYVQADRSWAEWIAWVLEENGYKIRIQAWDFRPGGNFVAEIQKATIGSERTIAVLSPDYLRSLYAMAEWAAAFATDPDGAQRKLIPILVRETAMEDLGQLASIVYIKLVGLGEAAAREAIIKGLATERAKPLDLDLDPPVFRGARPPFPYSPVVPPNPEAIRALNALPLDKVPLPGPLPVGSRMPLPPNPLFVGREEDLKTLARQLKAGDTSAVGQVETAAVTGLGGIGKTQLAAEFVHRYGRFFTGGVFWMSFADTSTIPKEIAECGKGLNLISGFDALSLEQQVRLVEETWQSPLPRLLVFDNCEDEELLHRWRPRFGNARVLITSRRAEWDQSLGVKMVPLTTLPRPASIEFLRYFRPDISETDAVLEGIAEDLGDLPLALHLAGSFLKTYRSSPLGQPASYLEKLRERNLLNHPSLQGRGAGTSPTGHMAHVGLTFALSFERLDPHRTPDNLAMALLVRAAWFAPGEPIPRSLLLETVHVKSDDLKKGLLAEDALRRLTDLGLMEKNDRNDLLIHRLVALWSRSTKDANKARMAVEEAILAEARRLNGTRNPALLLAWQPHLRAITDQALENEDQMADQLSNELGSHLWQAGDYPGARLYLERAVNLNIQASGAEDPDRANGLNSLGRLLHSQGDYGAARSYYEHGLAIREKVLGSEHPDTAHSLDDLGALLSDQGDLRGARPYYERALGIREKVLGSEHPDIALSLNNISLLLQHQGDLVGARPYLERALAIQEKVLGQEHPDTARSLDNLSLLLQHQGDLVGARPHLERALAIRERVLGPEHPETALSLNNISLLLQHQGDLVGARPYLERALAIRERVLGPKHPETALTLNSLGLLLRNQGYPRAARPLFERALKIFKEQLGPDHPYTKNARQQLAALKSVDR